MTYTRKKRSGGLPNQPNPTANLANNYIFYTDKISTQPNIDPSYKEIGIIHFTDSGAVNAVRQTLTGVSNLFGKKGFDNSIYDKIRNEALNIFTKKIAANQKVANIRLDIETDAMNTIVIHIYGTLLEKIIIKPL